VCPFTDARKRRKKDGTRGGEVEDEDDTVWLMGFVSGIRFKR